jgi:hypothetical protein
MRNKNGKHVMTGPMMSALSELQHNSSICIVGGVWSAPKAKTAGSFDPAMQNPQAADPT